MMNADVPAGIESYLREAGFTSTEMLVIKRLVEQDALTLREMAAKTGKSTGVLDQAMKKLMTKKIVEKRMHNEHPRYALQSLDAVVRWVQKDMKDRKNIMERKHQSFEDYISTLKLDKGKPDIQYYSGKSGIEQAYAKLLETSKEIVTMGPILFTPEDDPLRALKVELFRTRQYRKIFHRIIAPDTSVARKFRSRDPFEYRKTLLVPPEHCPFPFEKTIAGDNVVCIDPVKEQVSFIRFPELAKAERAAFEFAWQRALADERGEGKISADTYCEPVGLKTRIFSSLREFILSKKSFIAIIVLAILSGLITFGLYQNIREYNFNRLSERVKSIASVGALQINPNDVEAVHVAEDFSKPEYIRLVSVLDLIRRSDPDLQFAYVMRKTGNSTEFSFVADADSLNPLERKDINSDGLIDVADELIFPGQLYDISQFNLMDQAFIQPVSDFGKDQWGDYISGFAPIRTSSGEVIAILGIDMFSHKLDDISARTFSPLFIFVFLFLLFTFIRFMALNKSLLWECCKIMLAHFQLFILLFILCILLIVTVFYSLEKNSVPSHKHPLENTYLQSFSGSIKPL